MCHKIINLNEQRRIKHPRSLDEVAEIAVRRYFDPSLLEAVEEPLDFASPKSNDNDSFVPDGDDEIDDEDIYDAR